MQRDGKSTFSSPLKARSQKEGGKKKKKKEKKVVYSPFSALTLQMLMQSVLSWVLNRSKMLWFGSILHSLLNREAASIGD